MTAADAAPLTLRLAAGTVFLSSGLQKVVPGIESTASRFRELGVPWPEVVAPAVGGLELVGGLLLLAGLLTRPVATLFAVEMVAALALDRLPAAAASRSLADAVTAVRLEALLLAACGSLALLGAGHLAVDALVQERRRRGRSAGGT